MNKTTGHDDISYSIITECFDEICYSLLTLEKRMSPDNLKTSKVTPFSKADDTADLSNYRLISVPPYFLKMLETVMHIPVYQHALD